MAERDRCVEYDLALRMMAEDTARLIEAARLVVRENKTSDSRNIHALAMALRAFDGDRAAAIRKGATGG